MQIMSSGNSLGQYIASANSGTIAAGAGAASEIFHFRWTPTVTSNLALVSKIVLTGMYQLTGFTAGAGKFDAIIARAWTGVGTGGTAEAFAGNDGKLRTSHATSTGAEFRFPTTAALGAGTKTLDNIAFATFIKFVPGAVNTQVFDPVTLFESDIAKGSYPLVLANEEGFVVRATVPATGTWVVGCTVEWDEVTAF